MNLAFSVIAMEWFDKISEFMEGLPEWLQAHPRYGYLIVAGILLLWLVGIVCGWRWTYSRPGSWEGNFWLGTLGERSYRFWLGADRCRRNGMRPVAVLRNGISKRKTRKGGSYVQGTGILDVLLLEQEQTCKERQGGYLQCHVDDGNPVAS